MWRAQTERLLTQADFSSSEEGGRARAEVPKQVHLSFTTILLGRTAGLEVSAALRDLHSHSLLSCKLNL